MLLKTIQIIYCGQMMGRKYHCNPPKINSGSKQKITSDVENAVFSYYKVSFDPAVCSISDVAGLVDLLKIKIMYSETGENQEVGFIFSASFDPELGVGVLVSNGKIEDVDVQDIVLG